MAHKKGQGSSRNGRDSNAQRRGVKRFGGQRSPPGSILVRQVGTNSIPAQRRHGPRLHPVRPHRRRGRIRQAGTPRQRARADRSRCRHHLGTFCRWWRIMPPPRTSFSATAHPMKTVVFKDRVKLEVVAGNGGRRIGLASGGRNSFPAADRTGGTARAEATSLPGQQGPWTHCSPCTSARCSGPARRPGRDPSAATVAKAKTSYPRSLRHHRLPVRDREPAGRSP